MGGLPALAEQVGLPALAEQAGAPGPGRAGPGALRQLPAALASSRLPDLGVVFAWSPLLSHQTRDLISSSDPLFLPV